MDDKDIRKYEQRGYSRGYQAGMRRRQHEIDQLERRLQNNLAVKRERIFLSILNGLLVDNTGWKMGDEKVNDTEKYCKLAQRFTEKALKFL